MSKYKVGDKVVMEITDKVEVMEEPNYILSDATVVNQGYIDKAAEPLSTYIEQARAEGAETAWELVRKIFDMETNDIEDIFIKEDAWNLGTVLNNYTYQEAAAKVEAWEKAKEEIKVGDVVRIHEGNNNDLCILYVSTDKKYYNAIDEYGAVYNMLTKEMIAKTGRHIDIDGF